MYMKVKLFLLFLAIHCSVFAQINEKVIPVIKYDPFDYVTSIRRNFCLPKEYLKSIKDGDTISYYRYYQGKEQKTSPKFLFSDLPDNIFSRKDSLFILYFNTYNKYDYKIYGILKDGSVSLYKKKENKEYSLAEFITSEYKSMDNFKEGYIDNVRRELDFGLANGLYPENEKNAVTFLKEDFVMYELYSPSDSQGIAKLILNFLKRTISLTSQQEKKIIEAFQQQEKLPLSPTFFPISNSQINNALASILSEDQYKTIKKHIEIQDHLRMRYVYTLKGIHPEINEVNGQIRLFVGSSGAKSYSQTDF